MMKRWIGAAVLGVCSSTGAHAAGFDVSLGNETAYFRYLTDTASMGYGGADVGFGLFYNDNEDAMLTANFLVTGSPGPNAPLQYGIGAKGYYTDLDSGTDASAIGLGGQVRYLLPTRTQIGLTAEAYYAPEITSFSDAESFTEFTPRVEVEVMPSAMAYVGYRWIEADIEGGADEELSDEVVFGIRLQF